MADAPPRVLHEPTLDRGPRGRKQVNMTPEERKALISEIVEVMNSTKPQLSDEEMQWVRLAIEAESRKIRFRDAVIEKTLGSLVWSAIAAIGFLFLDYLKNRGLSL